MWFVNNMYTVYYIIMCFLFINCISNHLCAFLLAVSLRMTYDIPPNCSSHCLEAHFHQQHCMASFTAAQVQCPRGRPARQDAQVTVLCLARLYHSVANQLEICTSERNQNDDNHWRIEDSGQSSWNTKLSMCNARTQDSNILKLGG